MVALVETIPCPKCGSKKVEIIDTVENESEEYFVMKCGKCGKIFTKFDLQE